MELRSQFTEELIHIPVEATDKYAAIEEMIGFLIERGKLDPAKRDGALDALRERERSMSTGMEAGVALPHATVDFLDEAVCALGVHPHGIDFDSNDGLPAHIIVLMLVPQCTFTEHVRALAGISQLMHIDRLRNRLKKAKSPKEAMNIILEETPEK